MIDDILNKNTPLTKLELNVLDEKIEEIHILINDCSPYNKELLSAYESALERIIQRLESSLSTMPIKNVIDMREWKERKK